MLGVSEAGPVGAALLARGPLSGAVLCIAGCSPVPPDVTAPRVSRLGWVHQWSSIAPQLRSAEASWCVQSLSPASTVCFGCRMTADEIKLTRWGHPLLTTVPTAPSPEEQGGSAMALGCHLHIFPRRAFPGLCHLFSTSLAGAVAEQRCWL